MSVIPVIEEDDDQEPIYTPLPLPPRPDIASEWGFTPRFRSRGFDGRSFLLGVLVTEVFFLILGLIIAGI